MGEARQLGAALTAPRRPPLRPAIRQHKPQRREHQHAQQQLLVGQRHEVSAFLIKIGESGDAEKNPGLKASSVTPDQRRGDPFFSQVSLVFRALPKCVAKKGARAGPALKSGNTVTGLQFKSEESTKSYKVGIKVREDGNVLRI